MRGRSASHERGRTAARPAPVSVRLDSRPDGLAVQIDDDGQATLAAAPVPGMGLIGMRERVIALGGRLLAEPRPEGGFTVQAELPANGNGTSAAS